MGKIVWVASYPKSGNTWMRAFIEHLVSRSADIDLNELQHAGYMASSRRLFDRFSGIRASDLTRAEIDELRPEVYRALSRHCSEPVFVKSHDAFEPLLFPPDVSLGAIYLLRNPLDVAVSYAHHVSSSPDFDAVIERLCSPRNAIATRGNRLGRQLTVRTGDWSGHVRSWTGDVGFPAVTLRYEDLLMDPAESFSTVARLVAPDADRVSIRQAIERSSFGRLREFERTHGFRERGNKSLAFFRAGRAGAWKDHLSSRQVERLIRAHEPTMRAFAYLGADDVPAVG
jgi:hypothetical protein